LLLNESHPLEQLHRCWVYGNGTIFPQTRISFFSFFSQPHPLRNQKTATKVAKFINFRSQKIKFIYYLHHSCRVIENPSTITRNICLFEFRHPKVIDRRKHSFKERTQPLRNISQRSTKKRERRATLNTFKIMSPIKREMISP
jgi:predicted nucleic acid binding AN1-type Zn finger protein